LRGRHQAGIYQRQAPEQVKDLLAGTEADVAEALPHGVLEASRAVRLDEVVDEHATARRERVHQGRHEFGWLLLVEDLVQDSAEHQANRPVQVKQFAGGAQDGFGVAQVALHGERPLVVGQQSGRVRDHHRVVVQVDHADVRVHALGDLMHVLHCGQAGADVEQLGHALIADKEADDAGEHFALQSRAGSGRRHRNDHPVCLCSVNGEIVSPAEQVVIYAGSVGARGIDLGRLGHEKNSRPCQWRT